jgi:predicted DNA-binding ribbon-helix-helix protein
MAKGKFLNFTIPDELYEEIKEEAESKNISMASVVRIALSEYLKKEQKK